MRKIFLLTLLACCMLLGAVAQAAQITDVKWGVNKADVLRIVVDVTDTAGYAVDMEGDTLNLTVNADKGAQVPHSKAVKSSLADSLKIVEYYTLDDFHTPGTFYGNRPEWVHFFLLKRTIPENLLLRK